MKAINYLNYFFVGFPILLITLGFVSKQSNGELIGYGLLFTVLTGLFQIVFGITMLIDEPNDKNLKMYIRGVILFFSILIINSIVNLPYDIFLDYLLIIIPPILAIYFTIITYKKANK
jgi:hypothetical protein